jgi:hypothetical protein
VTTRSPAPQAVLPAKLGGGRKTAGTHDEDTSMKTAHKQNFLAATFVFALTLCVALPAISIASVLARADEVIE